jgi:predicted secreted protein
MRKTLLAIVMAILPASFALAEPPNPAKPAKPATSGRSLTVRGASNPCAAYGSGFVKIDGTDTCVKIGGVVGIGVGGSSGSR